MSQVAIHSSTKGIVPRVAAEHHHKNIPVVVREALDVAGCRLRDVAVVGVTRGPGLAFSLKAGVEEAVRLAAASDPPLPLVAVHHMAAHALLPRLLALQANDSLSFPFLGVLVSGGHTLLVRSSSCVDFEVIGTTLDDSIGDALDKGCNFLGIAWDLEHGPASALERCAESGDPHKFAFTVPFVRRDVKGNYSMSFSGFKTALKKHVQLADASLAAVRSDLAASYQHACFEHVLQRLSKYMLNSGASSAVLPSLVVSGGVAANQHFRKRLQGFAQKWHLQLHIPQPALCTDNGVMVAWAAAERFFSPNEFCGMADSPETVLSYLPKWPLSSLKDTVMKGLAK